MFVFFVTRSNNIAPLKMSSSDGLRMGLKIVFTIFALKFN